MDVLKASAAAFAIALAASPAVAAGLEVSGAWSRPTAGGAPGAGYMTVTNGGKAAEVLLSVESPAASRVEIHESRMSGGMATMRPVARLTIPANGAVTFAPGGYHLMFTGLKQPLKAGVTLPATLIFASGARVTTRFVVGMAPPAAATDHRHH